MPSNRKSFSTRLRFDVLRRCNFACYYCGVPAALGAVELHVDHVIPVSLGGTNDPWNLIAACSNCNLGKANMPPTPELVQQVRDDYCAYLSPKDARLDQCEYCGVPIELFDEEEPYGQCMRCNEVMADAFESGIRFAQNGGA